MKWIVTMIIPCDYEEQMNLCIDEEGILDRSELLSPLAGFVNLKCDVPSNDNYKDLFVSSGFGENVYKELTLDCFALKEVFHPYGIVLEGIVKFDSINSITAWSEKFYKHLKLRNVLTASTDEVRPKWVMTSNPIIVFEAMNIPKIQTTKLYFNLNYEGYLSEGSSVDIAIEDPIVIIPDKTDVSNSVYDDLINILKTVCVINSIGRKIRISLSKKLKKTKASTDKPNDSSTSTKQNSNDKFKTLIKLQKECAVINELVSSTTFSTCQQKRIYDLVKNRFHISDTLAQIDQARILIETVIEIEENQISERIATKAHAIEKTLFITGYIGLILSIFNFFPLTIKKLILLDVSNLIRWSTCICITIASVCACTILVRFYDSFKGTDARTKNSWKQFIVIIAVSIIIIGVTFAVLLSIGDALFS